jgi:hypothetical protein
MNPSDALSLIEQAEHILAKIASGQLYGTVIDVDNPTHVIVAAYMAGVEDGKIKQIEREDRDVRG